MTEVFAIYDSVDAAIAARRAHAESAELRIYLADGELFFRWYLAHGLEPLLLLATMVFAQRFRAPGDSGTAFGANLLGAILGGVLEYLSLIAGYRWLLVVVALLYGGPFITGRGHLRAVSREAPSGCPMAEAAR